MGLLGRPHHRGRLRLLDEQYAAHQDRRVGQRGRACGQGRQEQLLLTSGLCGRPDHLRQRRWIHLRILCRDPRVRMAHLAARCPRDGWPLSGELHDDGGERLRLCRIRGRRRGIRHRERGRDGLRRHRHGQGEVDQADRQERRLHGRGLLLGRCLSFWIRPRDRR